MWRSRAVCDNNPNLVLFPNLKGGSAHERSHTNPMMKCLARTKGAFLPSFKSFSYLYAMSQWKGRGGVEGQAGRSFVYTHTHTHSHTCTHTL